MLSSRLIDTLDIIRSLGKRLVQRTGQKAVLMDDIPTNVRGGYSLVCIWPQDKSLSVTGESD